MDWGANLFTWWTLESVNTTGLTYRDDQGGTGWDSNANITGLYWGRVALATASSDFTQARYIWFQLAYERFNAPLWYDTLANGWLRILFEDGSWNWARYNIGWVDIFEWAQTQGSFQAFTQMGASTWAETWMVFVIDRNRTPDAESVTSINWTDVDYIETHIKGDGTRTVDLFLWRINVADIPEIINWDVSTPWTYQDFTDYAADWSNDGDTSRLFRKPWVDYAGANGLPTVCLYGLSIWDGTTATRFDDSTFSLAFYPSRDAQENSPSTISWGYMAAFNGDDNNERIHTINQSASDVVLLTGGTYSGVDHPGGEYTWKVEGSTSGTCTITNCSFFRATEIALAHATATWCIFDDCEQVTITADTTLTGWIIRNCAGNGLYTAAAAGDFSDIGVEFKSSNSNYDLTIDPPATGTWDFSWISVESWHTLVVRNESASTAITVTVPAGISTSTSTAGGTVTIQQATDTFTINSSEASSFIQIFTTNTQTVLDSTTWSSLAYDHSGETVDYVVQKAGFLPQRVTGVTLSGTSSVTVTLVSDPVYDSSHGLTYTTDASWSRTNNELTVPTFWPTVRWVYSLMIDSFIAQSSLYNTAFNIQMNGPNSMFLIEDAEGNADSSIENMTDGWVRYINTSDTTTAEWAWVQSIGTATWFTWEYQQVDWSGTTDARATGAFDELIKVYGDATHWNFDYRGHLVLKYQVNWYREARVDVLSTYGISTLEPTLYVVAMEPQAISAATGDPALTITVTDHGATPVTWNGKDFSITITDNATPSTGENILRELNYNLSLDATYQGKDPFNWHEMVKELGSAYDTLRGYTEWAQSSTLKWVRVVQNDWTTPHPDFTRFQADDGTYYTPPVTSQISITWMPTTGADIRLQIVNETWRTASSWAATTAYSEWDYVLRTTWTWTENVAGLFFVCTTAWTSGGSEPTWDTTAWNTTNDGTVVWTTRNIQYYSWDPASSAYSSSYTDWEEFATWDTARVRFGELDGATSFKTFAQNAVVSSTGFTVVVDETADSVYASNAIDGSWVTKFTADFVNDEIDLSVASNFTAAEAYAFYCYTIVGDTWMNQFWDGVDAIDVGNYKIITATLSLKFDNDTTATQRQTDTARIFRDDGIYPVKDPTTSWFGIDINWQNPVFTTETWVSGLTAAESAQLNEIHSNSDVKVSTRLPKTWYAGKV